MRAVPKLRHSDIVEIFEMFETELARLTKISKVEKMKLRTRISRVLRPVLEGTYNKPEVIVGVVEDKRHDIVHLFYDPHGFLDALAEVLKKKLKL